MFFNFLNYFKCNKFFLAEPTNFPKQIAGDENETSSSVSSTNTQVKKIFNKIFFLNLIKIF